MTTVSAKATFANAIREPTNWFILLGPLLVTVSGIMRLIYAWLTQDGGAALFGLVLAVLGIVGSYLYLRYMPSIFFELSDEGFRYEAASRQLHFAWKDIEAVKLEPGKKRLTVWVRGKPQRMRYLGVAESEFAQVQQFLQAKLSEHGIRQN